MRSKKIFMLRLTFKEQMKLKYIFLMFYDLLIIILAFIYSIHVFSDGKFNLDFLQRRVIDGIFIIDYIVKFIKSKNKRKFFVENLWMLISLLPITQLKYLQALRLLHVFRLAKIILIMDKLHIPWLKNSDFYKKLKSSKYYINSIKFIVYNLILIPIIMQIVEPHTYQNYGDGLWWWIVTLTTVGYGDIFPSTTLGKLAASYTLFIGVFTYASFIAIITDYINFLLNKDQKVKQIAAIEKIYDLEQKIEKLQSQNENIIELLKERKSNDCE